MPVRDGGKINLRVEGKLNLGGKILELGMGIGNPSAPMVCVTQWFIYEVILYTEY